MDFSLQSVWELTKLFVRAPGTAARQIMAWQLPINVSVLMLVLSGVASGIIAAVSVAIHGPQAITLVAQDGTEFAIQQASPITTGVFSVLAGLGFSYLVWWVGTRSAGQGTLPEVLSVMAAFQIALTVLGIITVAADLVLPVLGLMAAVFVIVVGVRGIVHGVKESHRFEGVGRAIMVIIAAAAMLLFIMMIFVALFGPMLVGDLTEVSNAV